MASLKIVVTNKRGGPALINEEFKISRELAQEFVDKMEAMVVDLPGCRHKTKKTVRKDGAVVVEIELSRQSPPPPVISPTFQELFGREETDDARKSIGRVYPV